MSEERPLSALAVQEGGNHYTESLARPSLDQGLSIARDSVSMPRQI